MSDSVTVIVAFDSGFGHTARMAESVRDGVASVMGADVELVPVATMDDAAWERLDRADAIVFGSPTYMGSASPAFHAFAYHTGRRWHAQAWKDKIAAGFTNSGSMSGDKVNTLQYFTILAAQHGMHWVNLDLLPGDTDTDLNRLGGWLGAIAQSGDAPPDEMNQADLATAAHLGQRVATHARLLAQARSVV